MNKKILIPCLSGVLMVTATALLLTWQLSVIQNDAKVEITIVDFDNTKAKKAIEALGGIVNRGALGEGLPLIDVAFDNSEKLTDKGLKELARLKSLRFLVLTGTQVTDTGMKELVWLKNL